MTVNTTPRLGLISPVDSDLFEASDYASTFGKLDAQPGIKIVSSYSALTAYSGGFSTPTNHHGEVALDTSTGAQWWWDCPSGSGTWNRLNSVGLITWVSNSTNVSSSATTGNGQQIITTGNITAPGKRALRVDVYAETSNTNAANIGAVVITVMDNGSVLYTCPAAGGPTSTATYIRSAYLQSVGVNSTHNFSAYIRSSSVSAGNGGGGTSTSLLATMAVTEL